MISLARPSNDLSKSMSIKAVSIKHLKTKTNAYDDIEQFHNSNQVLNLDKQETFGKNTPIKDSKKLVH
jgi:hypothetical protein